MLSSGIIDLAIGLAFIFGVTAALASVITEMIARFLGLRGAYLLAGLRELLDNSDTPVVLTQAKKDFGTLEKIVAKPEGQPGMPVTPRPADEVAGTADESAVKAQAQAAAKGMSATNALLGSPILHSQGMTGNISARSLTIGGPSSRKNAAKIAKKKVLLPEGDSLRDTLRERRSLPSYISSRSFAEAIMDMVIPNKLGQTDMAEIQQAIDQLPPDSPLGPLKASLESLAKAANGDITRFRDSVEHWYDDHMDRVSGWYKRRTALITLIAGGILVLLLNINAITIGRALYSDSATRTAVSTAAAAGNPCPASSSQQDCLAKLEKQVSDVAQAGLPLGWGIVPACTVQNAKCGWLEQHGITTPGDGSPWQVILALIGFLATIVALAPGAQFWFGLVVKLNSLRSTGPPPATSAS